MLPSEHLPVARHARPERRRNYWPLLVPPACIGLWWCILAIAFSAKVANTFAIIVSCAVAVVAALALLADALRIEDKLLHGDKSDDSGQTPRSTTPEEGRS